MRSEKSNIYGKATYGLKELQELISNSNTRVITRSSRESALNELGYYEEDIVRCVLELNMSNIYKTMEARQVSGLMQDVYHKEVDGKLLYIKLQKNYSRKGVVISFKLK